MPTVFLAVLLASSLATLAQTNRPSIAEEYTLRRWGVEDGLPEGMVTSIQQFPDGFLWMTTLRHIVRFDGVRFQALDTRNWPEPRPYVFRGLYRDREGNVWVYGEGGAMRCSDVTWTAIPVVDGVSSWRPVVYWVREAPDGQLWAATNRGMCRFNGSRFVLVPITLPKWPSLPKINGAAMDSGGRVWLAAGDALLLFAKGSYERVPLPEGNPVMGIDKVIVGRDDVIFMHALGRLCFLKDGIWQDLQPFRILDLAQAGPDDIWLAAVEGLARLRTGQIEQLMGKFDEVPTDVQCVFMSADGLIWAGTSSGLYRLGHRVIQLRGTVNALRREPINALWVKPSGELICTVSGVPSIFSGMPGAMRGGALSHVTEISSICQTSDGNLWIGSLGDHLWKHLGGMNVKQYVYLGDRVEAKSRNINCLLGPRDGRLWVGTREGVLFYGGNPWLGPVPGANDSTLALAEDAVGRVWAGTQSSGLWQVTTGGVQRVIGSADGLPSDTVRLIQCDTNGVMWVGTPKGIVRVVQTKSNVSLSSFNLPSDDIRQLLDDGRGNLWIGTRQEIYRVAKAEFEAVAAGRKPMLNLRVFGREEGLDAALTSNGGPLTARLADGTLWFATKAGLAGINLSQLPEEPPFPPVYIEGVDYRPQTIDHRLRSPRSNVHGLKSVSLPPGSRDVEFSFNAPVYVAPERAMFRYRLEGYDMEWSRPTVERTAFYPRLPPGHYRFRVMGSRLGGEWHEVAAGLSVVIDPFFWQTWWFRGLAGLTAISIMGIIAVWATRRWYKVRLARAEQAQALALERERIARDIHDDLGTGISEIAMMTDLATRQAEQGNSEGVVRRLREIYDSAEELARSVDEIVWAVTPANDTLPKLVAFISQTAGRYLALSGLEIREKVSESLPDSPVPAAIRHHLCLAVREALHNVVSHAHARGVGLEIDWNGSHLVIRVEDDGQGFDQVEGRARSEDGHDGLANMQRRMGLIGGECHIRSEPGNGTKVIFTVLLKVVSKVL